MAETPDEQAVSGGAEAPEESRAGVTERRLQAIEERLNELAERADRLEAETGSRADRIADARVSALQAELAEQRSADIERLSALVVDEAERSKAAEERLGHGFNERLLGFGEALARLEEGDRAGADTPASATGPPAPPAPVGPAGADPGQEPAAAQPAAEEPGSGTRWELSTVNFEGLRALGCSVTQAARILGARNAGDGLESVAALDRVPGLPAELRAELKRHLF